MDYEDSINQAVQVEAQQFIQKKQQEAVLQQTISALTGKCWDQCIRDPSGELQSRESKCVSNCVGRYFDSRKFVMQKIMGKMQGGQ